MKKNILMIGGSCGIGNTIAKILMIDYQLYVASRTQKGLENIDAQHILFDATKDSLDKSLLPEDLHGFIFCPGSINLKPFKMMSMDIFKDDMELNFFSLVNTVKEIMPIMQEGSSMIFFSTVAVSVGMPFHTSVAGSKGAIEGFAKSLAAEYAPKIRVNVIAPSLVDTPLSSRLLSNEKKREMMALRHPLKRIGEKTDIANAAEFLISDKSSWMTGQVIGVDGGISTIKTN
ncbi:NAD(P)-dependent dehydrogenase (short-subunit alcohol dehydrogenase family) [Saonia flava]|uniref:NAD(P)-dependent dehydrogenase (Short-subunit alcohol dehydrogenase family) n=1 Tax=Saonia flava TaxID=523696 RepID=A0A846QYG9_9FLAO|nr:SDR family oxidoreductase [Saonia flava]NJB70174.1 NAD(P)-dependent dehydrogenase (short-subunit alcohol dehydrogenase family) [Saonia flava]